MFFYRGSFVFVFPSLGGIVEESQSNGFAEYFFFVFDTDGVRTTFREKAFKGWKGIFLCFSIVLCFALFHTRLRENEKVQENEVESGGEERSLGDCMMMMLVVVLEVVIVIVAFVSI